MKKKTADSFNVMSFNVSIPMVREAKGNRCATPQDVIEEIGDIRHAAQECFMVLTLDTKNFVIDRHLISIGILNASLAHPREVFRPAILDHAASIILSHNHPSGDPSPSAEDLRVTRQLIEVGKTVEISVLDHVIVGRKTEDRLQDYVSLREAGLVTFN